MSDPLPLDAVARTPEQAKDALDAYVSAVKERDAARGEVGASPLHPPDTSVVRVSYEPLQLARYRAQLEKK